MVTLRQISCYTFAENYCFMKSFIFLAVAVMFEIAGTSALKVSEQFTKMIPSVITILAYVAAFYFLSLSLRTIPIGIAYAIWSGIGIVLISVIGVVVFKQYLDLAAIAGICLIIMGVVVINFFSKSVTH